MTNVSSVRSMRSRILLTLVGVVAITSLSTIAAQPTEASTPVLSVHVYCYSNPERVVVHNNRSYAVTVRSVGSRYQPYSNEPIPSGTDSALARPSPSTPVTAPRRRTPGR